MTTANLSVGLDTSKAKAGLQQLKDELARVSTVAVAIDPTSIDQSIQNYLKQRTFKVKVNTRDLAAEVGNDLEVAINRKFASTTRTLGYNQAAFAGSLNAALNANFNNSGRRLLFDRAGLTGEIDAAIGAAFTRQHLLRINTEALTAEISGAAERGLAGHHVGVSGGGAASAALPVGALQAAIVQSLNPAMEELGKAAALLAGTANRIAGEGRAAPAGRGRASLRYSAKDDDSGATTSYAAPLEDSAKALADIKSANTAAKESAQALKDAQLMHKVTNLEMRETAASETADARDADQTMRDTLRYRRVFRTMQLQQARAAAAQEESEYAALQAEVDRRAKSTADTQSGARLLQDLKAKSAAAAVAQEESEYAALQAAADEAQASVIAVREGEAGVRKLRQQAADTEAAAAAEAAKEAEKARVAAEREQQRIAKENADMMAASSRETFRVRQRLAQQEAAEQIALQRQLAAEQAKALKDQMDAVRNAAIVDARKSYRGDGPQIAGAQAIASSSRFTPEQKQGYLGTSGLNLAARDLAEYQRQVKETATSHNLLASSAENAVKSAVRLALVYGVGSELVQGLREVFKVGKDVEYQLKFVSLLSDDAAVSTQKFNEAVRGTNATPTEAANALRGLAQNGLNVADSLQALPTILNLATVGEMNFEQAALSATGVMASFNLQLSDLPHIADVFSKAAAISNTSVAEMTESMKYASTVGELYHVKLEETAASLATLAQHNIVGTSAGTAYTQMLAKLYGATSTAKNILDSMGISATTSNGDLKDSVQLIGEVKSALSTLNDGAKVNFIEGVFGKRESKSIETLLGDFDGLKDRLDIVTNHVDGFADSMAHALNLETTTGRAKALLASFETSATTAFNNSSNGVQNLLDHLNEIARSKGFIDALNTTISSVVNLSRLLVDHGGTLLATVAIWGTSALALKALAAASKLEAEGTLILDVAIKGLGTSFRAMWAEATLGLTLVISLVAEYYALSQSTDAASEAQERYNQTLREQHDQSENSLKAMQDQIALNRRIIELQSQGMSLTKARAEAEKGAATTQVGSLADELKKHQDILAAENRKPQIDNKNPDNQYDQRVVDRESATISALGTKLDDLKRAASAKSDLDSTSWIIKRNEELTEFNRRIDDAIAKNAKLASSIGGMRLTNGSLPQDQDGFESALAERRSALNKQLGDLPDQTSGKAGLRSTQVDLHNEEEEIKRYIQFRKQLDDAKYNPKLFGEEVAAELSEQRELQASAELIKFKTDALEKLRAAYAKLPQNAQSRGALRDQIATLKQQVELENEDLDVKRRVAALNAQAKATLDQQASAKTLSDLSASTRLRNVEEDKKVSTQVTNPVDAARLNAELQVESEYRKAIAEAMAKQVDAQASLTALELDARLKADNEDQYNAAMALVEIAKKRVVTENEVIEALKTQRDLDSQSAGNTAAKDTLYSESAEYGFKKFWKDYTESGQTAAKTVQDAMKTTTDAMSTLLNTFVTKGKLDWRSFADSIATEALQILEKKEVSELLGMFASMGGNSGSDSSGYNGSQNNPSAYVGGSGSNTSWLSTAGSILSSIFLSENGNVMTGRGPLSLNKYANGGVATSPQLSIFGEGKTPEAYVPLPDGRSIPVTMAGGGSSGDGDNNVTVNVALSSNGQSQVETDASGKKAQQLGDAINNAITERLAKERRPGGLLYA